MNKLFPLKINKHLPFLVGLVLSFILLWPFFASPAFSHHDDVQYIRLFQMHKCFEDFQIPCRWVPDLGAGYGYPLFNYYAPLPYYVGEVFYLLTGSLLVSVKLMFGISFLGAYTFMYLLARKLWGDWGGVLSAIFYSYAPYHALDFYVRGAMGEMWGLFFIPAVAWSAIKLKENLSFRSALFFAFLLACLITSHNLSAMLFFPILLMEFSYLFLNIDIKRKRWRFLGLSVFSMILGFGLAAFYFLPAYFEKELVHIDSTTIGYFSYTEHFKGLRKLLIDRSWEYGGSFREVPGGERDTLSYQIGWIHLLGWVLSVIVAFLIRKTNQKLSNLIFFISGLILFSIFMIHPRSLPVWSMIEQLKYLQFPWRFLLLITFLISLLSGSIIFWLQNNQKKQKLVVSAFVILSVLLVIFNFMYFKPKEFLNLSDKEILSGTFWEYQLKRSILDYLPISAKEPPAEIAPDSFEVLAGEAEVKNHHKGSDWFKFDVNAKDHTIIRISNYYFPDWKIFINGKESTFEYQDNNLGLMSIILGEGDYVIEGRLYNTPIRNVANSISVVSIFILVSIYLLSFPNVKKAIRYYIRAYK